MHNKYMNEENSGLCLECNTIYTLSDVQGADFCCSNCENHFWDSFDTTIATLGIKLA